MSLSEKAKTFDEIRKIHEALIPNPEDATIEKWKEFLKLSEFQKWVRLEDAQQEIDKLKNDIQEKSECYAKLCARLHEHIIDLDMERSEQKQKLRDKIIRLLQIRAGGHYQMFEAGMIYQCLMLLGMPEYTRHKQVDALAKITCHYFHESDAKKQLEKLLKYGGEKELVQK